VTLECSPEDCPDLSWADEETLAKLDSGEWQNLTFKVAVYDRNTGAELAADYLGNSIYADPADFLDHREAAKQTRELRASGSPAVVGSYFSDMVRTAIAEARKVYNAPRAKLHA
jgi:hypothetical protein